MAYLSKREICNKLAITEPYLNMNIKRGKVVIRSDKLIDDTNLYNSDFITRRLADKDERLEKQRLKELEPEPERKISIKKEDEVKEPQKERVIKPEITQVSSENSGYDLDKQKKKLEIEKLQKDVHLKEIELKKKQGEVIPVDVINGLISRLGKNYVTSFKNEADKYLTHVVNRTGADRETANKLKGDLVDAINSAIKETLEITTRELEAEVKNYTVNRK